MAIKIMGKEGVPGFYRGFIPSAIKNLPNKGFPISVDILAPSCPTKMVSLMLDFLSFNYCSELFLTGKSD